MNSRWDQLHYVLAGVQTESVKLSNKQTEYADADHEYTNGAPDQHHPDQDHGGDKDENDFWLAKI